MSIIYSSAFNELGSVAGQPDPRTGIYSKKISLGQIIGSYGLGPKFSLNLQFNPLDTIGMISTPFGCGWSLTIPCYQYDSSTSSGQLIVLDGQNYVMRNAFAGRQPTLDGYTLQNMKVSIPDPQTISVIYASGENLILTYDNTTFASIKTLTNKHGRSLNFNYLVQNDASTLTSIKDDTGATLVTMTYSGPSTTITFFPDYESETYSVVLSMLGSLLDNVSFSNDLHTSNFLYQSIVTGTEAINYISGYNDSNGLSEQATYSSTLALPNGAPVPAMYAVTTFTSDPGAGQPASYTTYEYGVGSDDQSDAQANNYFGNNTNVMFASNVDTLSNYPRAYSYTNRLTQRIDGNLANVETYTYDKFHSQVKLVTTQDNGAHLKTETAEYYVSEADPITNQSPIYMFPKQKKTLYEADGKSREEVIQFEWDETSGNLLKKTSATGIVTTFEYYPADGETGLCPPDPNQFSIYLKEKIVYPVPDLAAAPIRHRTYTYDQHPRVDSADGYYVAVTTRTEADDDGNIYHRRSLEYYDDTTQLFTAGRKKQITDTFLSPESGSTTYDTTHQLTYTQDTALCQVTSTHATKGFDGTIDSSARTKSYLSGLLYSTEDVTSANVALKTAYSYDGLRRITSRTVCPGTQYEASNQYEYINAGDNTPTQKIITKANGSKTRQSVDGHGKLVKTETLDIDNILSTGTPQYYVTAECLYDALSRKASESGYDYVAGDTADAPSVSVTTTYSYDSWGEVESTQVNGGYTVIGQSDPIAQTRSRTVVIDDVPQQQSLVEYDPFNNPKTQTQFEADGTTPYATTSSVGDGAGRTISSTDALRNVTQTSYDFFDRSVQTTHPDGSREALTYAPHSDQDLPTSFTWFADESDTTGIVAGEQEFDGLDRVTTVQIGQRKFLSEYTGNAPVPDSITTPAQNTLLFTRQPELGYATLESSLAAPPPSTSDEAGLTYTYDPVSGALLTSSALAPDGDEVRRTVTYYPSGRVKTNQYDSTLASSKATGCATYSYSLGGSITSWTDAVGNSHTIKYSPEGFKSEHHVNDQLSAIYHCDNSGRVTSTQTSDADGNTLTCALAFDTQGRETTRTLTLPGNSVQQQVLGYDLNDRVISRNWTRDGTLVRAETYTYDSVNRLTDYGCTGPELPDLPDGYKLTAQHFEFDVCGNVSSVKSTLLNDQQLTITNTATLSYSSAEPTQLTQISNDSVSEWNVTLQYDADGNMVTDDRGRQLSFNARGQLLGLSASAGTGAAQLWYDASGLLVGEKCEDETDATLLYYAGSQVVNEVQGAASATWLESQARLLSGFSAQDSQQLLGSDQQGSIVKAYEGGEETSLVYSPHGYCAVTGETLNTVPASYTGARRTRASGYYLLGNGYRGYNAVLGRFASWDSSSPFNIGGGNGYIYCAGDPVNRIDPSGHGIFRLVRRIVMRTVTHVISEAADAGVMSEDVATGVEAKIIAVDESPFTEIPQTVLDNFDPLDTFGVKVATEFAGDATDSGIENGFEIIKRGLGRQNEYRLRKARTLREEVCKQTRLAASHLKSAVWKTAQTSVQEYRDTVETISPFGHNNLLERTFENAEKNAIKGASQEALSDKETLKRANDIQQINAYATHNGMPKESGAHSTNTIYHDNKSPVQLTGYYANSRESYI
ncbi:hypothetical protein LFL96_12600 [Paraburkholderia sp. D15]|uniref:RHS repeat-associated core domain-containing protein n=1 Tax=Paraburkholderia sp. D15 TaxID=2880218 RepID=UPI00247AEC7C|nr:RHS repeat-associated core domain-containing protein [Paraburkholderia sp. D15]WGS48627.1 hypothetical protein LFL96_12600 [Paraburkholderia sp. D15]